MEHKAAYLLGCLEFSFQKLVSAMSETSTMYFTFSLKGFLSTSFKLGCTKGDYTISILLPS